MSASDQLPEFARLKAFDQGHYHQLEGSGDNYLKNLSLASEFYSNINLARDRAAYIKWKSLENLDKYLIEFESNFIRHGGKLIWAPSAKAAIEEIGKLLAKKQVSLALKGKSPLSQEIGLDSLLKNRNIPYLETDFGEFIQQLSAEKSYHMSSAAIHKTRDEVLALLHKNLDTHEASTNEEMLEDVRNSMRKKFRVAELHISDADFLVADSGYIALSENEGNKRLGTTFPPTQIILAGIDSIIPTLADLETFWPLLSTYSSGQPMAYSHTLLSGPGLASENEGPRELYLVLIDNGRSDLLIHPEQRPALSCIHCGACANVCPVYRHVGGHAYSSPYPGPIATVVNPYVKSFKEFHNQAYASTLCGACRDVCPVKIDIPKLMLHTRRLSVKQPKGPSVENYSWKQFSKMMLTRKKMNQKSSMKNLLLRFFFLKRWGRFRELPLVADKTFNQLWREQHAPPK